METAKEISPRLSFPLRRSERDGFYFIELVVLSPPSEA